MVLLVRCKDNTCSVALKSRLNDLVNDGLVTAYLRNGEWIAADKPSTRQVCKAPSQPKEIRSSVAASL